MVEQTSKSINKYNEINEYGGLQRMEFNRECPSKFVFKFKNMTKNKD